MSSTNRGSTKRIKDDNYPTPPWVVDRLLEAVDLPSGRWIEPCAGEGAIIRDVNSRCREAAPLNTSYHFQGWPRIQWTAIELRDTSNSICLSSTAMERVFINTDFLAWADNYSGPAFDVAIGNPPYSKAREFIDASLKIAQQVVFILRLNFLGSEDREPWFRKIGLPDVYVLPNRPDFTGTGGDSCEYAWMVFSRLGSEGTNGTVRLLATTPRSVRMAQKPGASQKAAASVGEEPCLTP